MMQDMHPTRYRCVALLGRTPGLHLLEHGLLKHPRLDLLAVATHRRLPKAEDAARGERPEYARFVSLCEQRGIPLIALDSRPEATDLPFLLPLDPVDILCSLSWRYILSAKALSYPRLGAINLHRGALPEFAGEKPVERMLKAGAAEAVITAHLMVETVDAGRTLATVHLPMHFDQNQRPEIHAETVKQRLVPLYPKLFDLALETLIHS